MEVIAFVALMPVLAVVAIVGWVLWKVALGLFWGLGNLLKGVGLLLKRVLRFARGTLVGVLHIAGALATAAAVVPLTLANLAIGRWEAARHYGRAIRDEFGSAASGIYRVAIAGPLGFLGLGNVIDRVETRLAEVVNHAPRSRTWRGEPRRARAREREAELFAGYDVLGNLPTGGSGARLYLARPRPATHERFRALGRELPEHVVIKSFALDQGSTLPQIVRESRALEAASKLGLVLEHELRADRFHYITRYVAGERLDEVGARLHERSGSSAVGGGLGRTELALVLGYAQDLLRTLHRFHAGGLWHKDVKPANVIVAEDRAHLVDFGLVTPLSSALTLTTHGTEYYRDPEMVRMALQGVKVHEVDGVKFDLYSTGAVLYSLLENSFPAQGSLSRISKRAPEALAWIVRRSMADIQERYGSAAAMLADLEALARASDPYALRPADLPSFRGEVPPPVPDFLPDFALAGSADAPRAERGFWTPPTSSRRSSKRRRRLVGAAGLVAGLSVFGALFGESRRHHSHASSFESAGWSEPRLLDAEREAFDGAQEILRLVEADQAADAGDWSLVDQILERAGAQEDAAPSDRTAAAAALEGARVLLLEDFSGEDEELVENLDRLLRQRGIEVVGRGPVASADEVTLIAGARHAIGLGGPGDAQAVARLESYLRQTPELAGILWMSPATDGDGGYLRLVVQDPEASDSDGLYRLEEPLAALFH